MVDSVQTYEQLALGDRDGFWELDHGVPRRKPGMTLEHNRSLHLLYAQLVLQLDAGKHDIRGNSARLRVSTGSYYIPDLCVLPMSAVQRAKDERSGMLEVYDEPLPLVVEVWSPSTGDYDIEVKLREYQLRGDAEIWRIHPYERTLTAWQLQPDGSYSETLHRAGAVEPIALPGVRIDLAALFT